MIKRIIILVLLLMFVCSSGLFAGPHKASGIIPCDWLGHGMAAYGATLTISGWLGKYDIRDDYGLYSIGIPVIVGYLKETYDWKSPNFRKWNDHKGDKNDAYYDLGFCLAGALAGYLMSGVIDGKLMTYKF